MSASVVKGWCPGALRPMLSGDGLVVRVRPFGGRLEADQIAGLAELAGRYGNGLIDVTSRANLQIRGVDEQGHPALLEGLARLRLLDPDADIEARRNILVTPFWNPSDETQSLAAELEEALAESALALPGKFGFAIDDGRSRVLAGDSADVRIERDAEGRLLVRADAARLGRSVGRGEAVSTALALANWFIASGGAKDGRGRMAAHIATGAALPEALRGETEPAPVMAASRPGHYPQGAMVGVAFGQMLHTTLDQFSGCGHALRMTPWRMVLSEGKHEMPSAVGLITEPHDPALRVIACSGAPRCREAHADTRALAAALAPRI
ncbi:precorrin-3B synthase, partial [Bradyrhizobium sp. AS23.2]|uniref:precorrin-3B synthase n=1 Tax=Bradyrhizobium sp. AS23.2 TaxID=1680155 RepID=UPI00093F2C0B